MRSVLAALLIPLSFGIAHAGEKREQLIIVSFDGAHDNHLWARSRVMAKKTGAHFTYFLSCTYLMNPADRRLYRAPHQKRARSNTGFALSVSEVQARLGHIWQAHLDGHEMASHACGHFDGKDWTSADWAQEFADFDRVLLSAWQRNGLGSLEPAEWRGFVKNDIRGFRAPYLSAGGGLMPALKAKGFRYDASLVSRGPVEPEQSAGLTRFALPRIAEGPGGRPVIAMDYNLFIRHAGGLNSPARPTVFEARTLAAFRYAFEAEYAGKRVPLQLGFHFVEMNGGAYWAALDAFLTETCHKPDVACVSYAEAMTRQKDAKKAVQTAF